MEMINGNIYIGMLINYAYPQVKELQLKISTFQLEVASPNLKQLVKGSIKENYLNSWIGC